MKKYLGLLLLMYCQVYLLQAQCIEFVTPYQNLSAAGFGASLCGDNCRDTTILNNGVWPNEAYMVDALHPGAEYQFNFCDGYSEDLWTGVITAVYYAVDDGEINLLEENILQVDEGCEMLLTIPTEFEKAIDVAFIVTEKDSCGTGLKPFQDNGIPHFSCGPNGGQPDCPKIVISCADARSGILESLDTVCTGDVMGIEVDHINVPTEENSGFVLVVSTEDLQRTKTPNKHASFVTILDTILATRPPGGNYQTSFLHDESILEAGNYFLTPVSFGKATRREPQDPFRDINLNVECVRTGVSQPFTLLPSNDQTCIQSCKKINDGGFETGKPNNVWEEYSLNFDSPLCDSTCSQGVPFAFEGDWWAWFGGKDDGEEEGILAQDFNLLNASNASLTFRLAMILEPEDNVKGDDEFAIRIDNEIIFSITDRDHEDYDVYQLIEIDLASYIDGCTHNLQIYGKTNGGEGEFTNIFVDNVSLNACSSTNCSAQAGELEKPEEDSFFNGDEMVQLGVKDASTGGCMTYAYLLTTGSPDYEIIQINQTGTFSIQELLEVGAFENSSVLNVHGLAIEGSMETLNALNISNALDLQTAIKEGIICADLMMEEEEVYTFGFFVVGLDEDLKDRAFSINAVNQAYQGANTLLSFNYPKAGEKLEVGVYDLNGKLVAQKAILTQEGEQQTSVDVQNLNNGMYIISLRDKQDQVSMKWVKE